MESESIFKEQVNESLLNLKAVLENKSLHESFNKMVDLIFNSLKNGGTLFVAGNGGSAADAQHLVAELVVKLNKNRDPIRAVALTVDTSIITAAGNDFSYDDIFSRQLEALARPNDVFLGITTSGNSANIINAFDLARKLKVQTICLTGKEGGRSLKEGKADLHVIMNGPNTARIQEGHEILYHTLCWVLEKKLVDAQVIKYK